MSFTSRVKSAVSFVTTSQGQLLDFDKQAITLIHRFDAFRSIFPAGTVSGAPKVKAIQLISGLEKEKRGVYAGAVGRFDFDRDEMDTCIAIRTMTCKDGVVYLQAGMSTMSVEVSALMIRWWNRT